MYALLSFNKNDDTKFWGRVLSCAMLGHAQSTFWLKAGQDVLQDDDLGLHLFVNDVETQAVPGPLDLGDHVPDLLDPVHLLVEVVALQEVAEVGVTLVARLGVQVEQALVHRFLELEGGLHGLERSAPLHGGRLGNVLKLAAATTAGLVLHQLHAMITLLVGGLPEVGGEPVQRLVVPVEPRAHGEIDIAGVELHVDLLVDEGLAVLVEVLPDLGSHLATWSLLVVVVVVVV